MSQITKPIALDETLQDVVTAIQGITQGGMIVSTGNVGSATQPVYINGGVPTAGDVLAKYSSIKIQATAWDTYPNAHETRVYYYEGANTTTYNLPYQNVFVVVRWWSQDRAIARAFKWNKNSSTDPGYAMWINENHGVWQGWRQTYGITTGTPTNINSNLSYRSGGIVKSGNVVNVRLSFNIDTTFTPQHMLVICNLPWKPVVGYMGLTRGIGKHSGTNEDSGWVTGIAYFNDTSGALCLGFGDYGDCTAGKNIWIHGTYLTND